MTEPSPARAAVRTLTGLAVADLADSELDALLEMHGGGVKLAAADALEVVAGQIATSVTSDDISLDGSKRATILLARARTLRAQAADEAADSDDGFFFDVVGGTSGRPELTERECR